MAPEISNQRKVRMIAIILSDARVPVDFLQNRPGRVRQGKVVVNSGYRLHAWSVAMRQTLPVDGLRFADVRFSVLSYRDVIVVGQAAWHAAAPQKLVADVPVNNLVHGSEFGKTGRNVFMRIRNQFELCFTEIGGDVRMRER